MSSRLLHGGHICIHLYKDRLCHILAVQERENYQAYCASRAKDVLEKSTLALCKLNYRLVA